jgi:nucleoside-triphosphatase
MNNLPRILLTGPPQCGKTTVVQKVAAGWPGRAAGFYTREVRKAGIRLGFEIVTLAGDAVLLSHVDFPGPYRVGKYGVSLENFHRVALPALEVIPGVDLIVVDEVGKMECLSARFVAAMENLWAAPAPLLITVAAQGGGYSAALKAKPGKTLITVTPGNRDELPANLLNLLDRAIPGPGPDP